MSFATLGLEPWAYAFAFAVCALAGLVHGTLGLGFPLVSTPLLSLVTDVRTAVLLTLLPTVTVNVASILRGGDFSESIGRFWPLAVYSVVGAVIGAALLLVFDPEPFRVALALLVLLYLGATAGRALRLAWVASNLTLAMAGFGLAAGLAAGATNVMVPILVIFALELALPRKVQVQTFNLCFLAGKLSQVVVFGLGGALTLALLGWTAPLAAAGFAALRIGERIRDGIDAGTYRRWLRWLLFALAMLLLAQSARALFFS